MGTRAVALPRGCQLPRRKAHARPLRQLRPLRAPRALTSREAETPVLSMGRGGATGGGVEREVRGWEWGRKERRETRSNSDRNGERGKEMASGRNGDQVGDTDPGNLIRPCPPPGRKEVASVHLASPGKGKRALYSRGLLSAS